MNKNKFFEKVGKLTFSVVLTGFIVTAAVFAIVRTDFVDGQILSAGDLNTIQPSIDTKISKTDIPTCLSGESLTFDGTAFTCFSPAAFIVPEGVQAGTVAATFTNKNTIKTVIFSTPFSGIPKVVPSIIATQYSSSCSGNGSDFYKVYVTNVTKTGFKLVLGGSGRCHGKSSVTGASWIAIPPTGIWSSGVNNTAYIGYCRSGTKNTISVSGSCIVGSTSYYYSGKSACRYDTGRKDGEGLPINAAGNQYSNQYKQTCN